MAERSIRLLFASSVASMALAVGACGPHEQPAYPPSVIAAKIEAEQPYTASERLARELALTNLAEIAIGRLASTQASSAEVKAFGETIVNDHTGANRALDEVASQMGLTVPTDAAPEDRERAAELAVFQGADFDRRFLETIADTHERALRDIADAVNDAARSANGNGDASAANAALIELATSQRPAMEQHLERAREMRARLGK